MSAYGFGLKAPCDFLDKARREVARLEPMAMTRFMNADEVADTAINAGNKSAKTASRQIP
jgi:hypothetical protein